MAEGKSRNRIGIFEVKLLKDKAMDVKRIEDRMEAIKLVMVMDSQ